MSKLKEYVEKLKKLDDEIKKIHCDNLIFFGDATDGTGVIAEFEVCLLPELLRPCARLKINGKEIDDKVLPAFADWLINLTKETEC
jgi:hypothetical protein